MRASCSSCEFSNLAGQFSGSGSGSSQEELNDSRIQLFASTTYLFSKNPLGLSLCVSSIFAPRFTPNRSRIPVNADVPLRCIPSTIRQFFINSLRHTSASTICISRTARASRETALALYHLICVLSLTLALADRQVAQVAKNSTTKASRRGF